MKSILKPVQGAKILQCSSTLTQLTISFSAEDLDLIRGALISVGATDGQPQ